MQAEWENWLLDETNRCGQIGRIMQDSDGRSTHGKANEQQSLDGVDLTRLDLVRAWHEDYCGSCRSERDRVFGVGNGSSAL